MSSKIYTAAEVVNLINNTPNENIIIDYSREKNVETISFYNLSNDDIIDLLRQLDVSKYDKTEECDDSEFDFNVWYRFHTGAYLTAVDGVSDYVGLFIRIGIYDKNLKIFVRSFHKDDD